MAIGALIGGMIASGVANAVANASKNKGQSVTASRNDSYGSSNSKGSSSSSNQTTSNKPVTNKNNGGTLYTYSWNTPGGVRYTTSYSKNYADAAKEAGYHANQYLSSKASESNYANISQNSDYASRTPYTSRSTTFRFQTPNGVRTVTTPDKDYRLAAERMGIDLNTSRLLDASSYFDNRGDARRSNPNFTDYDGWGMEGAPAGYYNDMATMSGLADQYGMTIPGVNDDSLTAQELTNMMAQYGVMREPNQYGNYYVPEYNGLSADEIQSMYDDIYAQQEAQAQRQAEQLQQQYGYYGNLIDQQYDDLASQNYVQYMMEQKNLPQYLAANGLSGGATETSLLGLQSNYQNAINQGELARNQALAENNLQMSAAENEIYNNLASVQASLQQSAISAIMQAQQAEQAYNQWYMEYTASRTDADRNYALQMMQMAQEEARYQTEVARQAEQDRLALEQWGWQKAQAAAGYGDFSQLGALGIDTAGAKELYDLDLEQARKNAYSRAISSYSGGGSSGGSFGGGNDGNNEYYYDPPENETETEPKKQKDSIIGPVQSSPVIGDLVVVDGLGVITMDELKKKIQDGTVDVYENENGGYLYKIANGR